MRLLYDVEFRFSSVYACRLCSYSFGVRVWAVKMKLVDRVKTRLKKKKEVYASKAGDDDSSRVESPLPAEELPSSPSRQASSAVEEHHSQPQAGPGLDETRKSVGEPSKTSPKLDSDESEPEYQSEASSVTSSIAYVEEHREDIWRRAYDFFCDSNPLLVCPPFGGRSTLSDLLILKSTDAACKTGIPIGRVIVGRVQ